MTPRFWPEIMEAAGALCCVEKQVGEGRATSRAHSWMGYSLGGLMLKLKL